MTDSGDIGLRPAEAAGTFSGVAGNLSGLSGDGTAVAPQPGVRPGLSLSVGGQVGSFEQTLGDSARVSGAGGETSNLLGDSDQRSAAKTSGIDGKIDEARGGKAGADGRVGSPRLTAGDLARLAGQSPYQSSMPSMQSAPSMPSMPQIPSSLLPPTQSMLGAPGAISPLLTQLLSNASSANGMDGGPMSQTMGQRLPGDSGRVQDIARSVLGVPYAWGGGDMNGPTRGISDGGGPADAAGDYNKVGFDCSGLARYTTGQLYGVEIPRTSEAQYAAGMAVSPGQARPGDLFFPSSAGRPPGHVCVYLGNNQVLEAPSSGQTVKISPLRAGEFRTFHS